MRTDSIPDGELRRREMAALQRDAFTGNFFRDDALVNAYDNGYAVTGSTLFSSSQNYLTDVGAYTLAESYYGEFDMGGDLSGWDEQIVSGSLRGLRGGSWVGSEGSMRSSARAGALPSFGDVAYSFRIAEVPEPEVVGTLLSFGVACI